MTDKLGTTLGVSECRLVLTDIRQESKAARLFWIFKPSERVYGKPFDLYLSFRNQTINGFEGGVCTFQIIGNLAYDFKAEIPAIEPNERNFFYPSSVILNWPQ